MKILITTLTTIILATQVQAGTVDMSLEVKGLEPMKGQHFEGWNIIEGKAISTGRFQIINRKKVVAVDASGNSLGPIGHPGHFKFKVDSKHKKASTFVLTIEPNGDKDPGPSQVHLMGGDFHNKRTDIDVHHSSSLNTNFADASGYFILAAPTGGSSNQGVWFVDPKNGEKSLNLPELPEGWAYEGWIVNVKNNKKFSTGIFKDPSKQDADGAGFLAGPLKLSFPPVPGQDIVRSSVVLDDGIHSIVLTVEPYPDYDPAPFSLKILSEGIYSGAPKMKLMSLENISHRAPQGTVRFH